MQTVLTIITDVLPGELDGLRAVVKEIAADPAANAVLPLASFTNLHFASLVLVDGDDLAPTLIFENNIDGPLDAWLATLVQQSEPGLRRLYEHCAGWPDQGAPGDLVGYLEGHVVRPGAYHVGATGRTLQRILQEATLHDAIEDFLDREASDGQLTGRSPEVFRSRIQDFVRGQPSLAWAANPGPPNQSRVEQLVNKARLYGLVALAAVASPVLIPVLAVWAVVLVLKELSDPVQVEAPDPRRVKEISDTEDRHVQNHLASVIPVKPGFLRATTLPVLLYVLNRAVRVSAVHGTLSGIPSIHFAHWSLIDDRRHLLFLSNFDGSWESYLGDFIDKAAKGLTAVWSNTRCYPRTVLLVFKGAADGPQFRKWARANQTLTNAWYTAYPHLSMAIIDNNSAIREHLFSPLGPAETQAWLDRL